MRLCPGLLKPEITQEQPYKMIKCEYRSVVYSITGLELLVSIEAGQGRAKMRPHRLNIKTCTFNRMAAIQGAIYVTRKLPDRVNVGVCIEFLRRPTVS